MSNTWKRISIEVFDNKEWLVRYEDDKSSGRIATNKPVAVAKELQDFFKDQFDLAEIMTIYHSANKSMKQEQIRRNNEY